MLKLEDNPPILFPENAEISEIEGQWKVAHTKSRNEKALARALLTWNIPYFLPLIEKVTRRQGRRQKSLLPLFSGYVFFCGNQEDRQKALTTNRIAQVIEVVDQSVLIRDLSQIQKALIQGGRLDLCPHLKSGMRCRVTSGAFVGLEGVLVRKNNLSRLLLQIEMLGQAAALEIDSDLLEPAE